MHLGPYHHVNIPRKWKEYKTNTSLWSCLIKNIVDKYLFIFGACQLDVSVNSKSPCYSKSTDLIGWREQTKYSNVRKQDNKYKFYRFEWPGYKCMVYERIRVAHGGCVEKQLRAYDLFVIRFACLGRAVWKSILAPLLQIFLSYVFATFIDFLLHYIYNLCTSRIFYSEVLGLVLSLFSFVNLCFE